MFNTTLLTQTELTIATEEFQIGFYTLDYASTDYTSKHFSDTDGSDSGVFIECYQTALVVTLKKS